MKLFYSGSLDNIWCSLDQFKEEIKSLEKVTFSNQERLAEELLGALSRATNLENKLKVLTENYENYKNSMHERLNIIELGIHPPFHSSRPVCHLPHCPYCHRPGGTHA